MSTATSRRTFGKLAATLATAGASQAAMQNSSRPGADYYPFPADFVWGAAAASYQVEGAAAEDGRKPSVWDTYAKTSGRVAKGHTGDIACDHYHRYPEDIKLMNWLGVKAYRFSLSWSRVIPEGTGASNAKGWAFYDRLVDAQLAAGLDPYVTLFHWDLPQALEDRWGGWQSRETAKAFAEYASQAGRRLGDRVKQFFTINEFACFIDEGYGSGTKAPGKVLGDKIRNQCRHHALLGHGWAVAALRAAAPKAKVGIAENPPICVPVIETPEHIEASRKAMRELNAHYLTAVMEGKYSDHYLKSAGANAPKVQAGDMEAIRAKMDLLGLNIYTPTYVAAGPGPLGFTVPAMPASYPRMASPWLTIGPQIAYWAPRHVKEIWGVDAVYITENGCSADDVPDAQGRVWDTDRVMYVRNHLTQAQRAVKEGWPLKGYFWWSLMDNFEWNDGYTKRFGVFYVDFETQKRTAKLSADFYRELIRRRAVV